MQKWDDANIPNFVPQVLNYRTKDGKKLNIILDKNERCFKDWVAELTINGTTFYVDRDELVLILNKPTIKKENAIYG